MSAAAALLAAGALPAAASQGTQLPAACPDGSVPEDDFFDVAVSNPHEYAIDCLVWWGTASGSGDGSYRPSAPVSRAQLAAFLTRVVTAAGVATEATPDRFSDDDGHAHEDSINRLANLGVIGGVRPGTFAPNQQLSRAQMATLIVRAVEAVTGEPLPDGSDRFSDDDGNPHEPNINKLVDLGVTSGVGEGRYDPAGTVTRAQMGSFLARLLDRLAADGHVSPPPASPDGQHGNDGQPPQPPPSYPAPALQLGETRELSVASDPMTYDSGRPSMVAVSASGRIAAFQAYEGGYATAGPDHEGGSGLGFIYVRDVVDGTTRLASLLPDGSPGEGAAPLLSTDGRYLFYSTVEWEWTGGNENYWPSVIVRYDLATGDSIRVPHTLQPDELSGALGHASVDDDGSTLAFASDAQLLAEDQDIDADIYVVEVASGALSLVSHAGDRGYRDDPNHAPSISGDGRYVAFSSSDRNLLPADAQPPEGGGHPRHIYVYDMVTGERDWISRAGAVEGNHDSNSPTVSRDGRYVIFESQADNLTDHTPSIGHAANVYLADRDTATMRLLSTTDGSSADGGNKAHLSADGRFAVFLMSNSDGSEHRWDVTVVDLSTGQKRVISGTYGGVAANTHWPLRVSADGTHVAYLSDRPSDTGPVPHAFIHRFR